MINITPVFHKLQEFCCYIEKWELLSFEGKDVPYELTIQSLYYNWDKSDCSEVGLAFVLMEYFLKNSSKEERSYYLDEVEYRIKKLKESNNA